MVGVAALIVVIVVAINSLPNAGRGYRGPKEGNQMPLFAAPDVRGDLDGDANIKQDAGDDDAGNDTPACAVELDDVITACDLFEAKPLVLALSVPSSDCEDQLKAMERLSRDRTDVQFAAVVSGRPKAKVEEVVKRNGVDVPRHGGPRPGRLQPLPGGLLQHGGGRSRRDHARVPGEQAPDGGRARKAPAGMIEQGWISADLEEEFPELRLRWVAYEGGSGRSPQDVKERLRGLSNRYTGGKAVHLRQEPIPWAYRVFFRQVGIDPDDHRTPAEQAALDRMKDGAFRSRNLLDDALIIATVETGVPVIAFDADKVTTPLGLRLSEDGELLGGDGRSLSVRQIVVADADTSVAVLFGDTAEGRGVHPGTKRMLLCTIQVTGVPEISVEEALWTVTEVLRVAE